MTQTSVLQRWAPLVAGIVLALGALYLVTLVHAAGETLLAGTLLVVTALAAWIYTSQRLYAWRYLFPGIAAVVIFVVFPMLYTVAISFTNYSSRNLLSFERATAYFLDETYQAEGRSYGFTLLSDGHRHVGRFEDPDTGEIFLSPELDLDDPTPGPVAAVAAQADPPGLAPVELRELIGLQPRLRALTVTMPDGTEVRMSGLRQFGPVQKLYARNADGSLTNRQDGSGLRPGAGGRACVPGQPAGHRRHRPPGPGPPALPRLRCRRTGPAPRGMTVAPFSPTVSLDIPKRRPGRNQRSKS